MIASVSISSTTTPRYSIRRRGTISRPSSSRAYAAVRASPRSRPRRPCRGQAGDAPPRASGTSCRRPAPCPGRPAGGPRARARPARITGQHRLRASGRIVERVALGVSHRSSVRSSPSRSRLSSRTFTRGSPRKPEQRLLRVPRDAARTASGGHAARRRDAGDLVLRGRRADVGIEPRRRRRHEVDGDRRRRRWPRAARRRSAVIAVDERLARRPQVGAGRGRAVVAVGAGGRWTTPEVLRLAKAWPIRLDPTVRPSAVTMSEPSPGAGTRPGRRGDDHRVDDAGDHGDGDEEGEGRHERPADEGGHRADP